MFTRKIEEAIAMEACALSTDACSTDFLLVKNQYKHLDDTAREERQLLDYHKGRTDLPPIRSNFFCEKRSVFFLFCFFKKNNLGSAQKR